MPEVVHCKKRPDAFYIGRKKYGYHFGNPFSHKPDSLAQIRVETREQAIKEFENWLLGRSYLDLEQDRRIWILNNLYVLKDKDLGCWCWPIPDCHGQILLKLAND